MDALVVELLAVLGSRMCGAYGFFGHSLGARIAFELARAVLTADRRPPVQLFLSGARAPHLPRRAPVHTLPDEELLAELQRVHELPDEIFADAELRALFLPILRADFALHDSHRYRDAPPLPVPISVFGGTDDPIVPVPDLEAWSLHTSEVFRSRTFPGRHLFLRAERRALIESISQDLAPWLTSPT